MISNLTFDQLPQAIGELAKEISEIKQLLLAKSSQQSNTVAEHFLSIQEASRFLNLSVPTIYSKVSKGELPVMKRGKRLHFSSIELMQYIKEGRKKTNAEIEAEALTYLKKKR